ncbi:MAG: hypothetical protein GY799_07550 [Desulfobulbaceae bacterium]|nr:hypothetical protein [Desulfobulbaceae bacterium]
MVVIAVVSIKNPVFFSVALESDVLSPITHLTLSPTYKEEENEKLVRFYYRFD